MWGVQDEAFIARTERTVRAAEPRLAPAPSAFSPSLDDEAALMRRHLDRARPPSDAEALRLLREAFPGAPLAARVAAISGRNRQG